MDKTKTVTVAVSMLPEAAGAVKEFSDDCDMALSEAWRRLVYAGATATVLAARDSAQELREAAEDAHARGSSLAVAEIRRQIEAIQTEARAALRVAKAFATSYGFDESFAVPSAATILQMAELD